MSEHTPTPWIGRYDDRITLPEDTDGTLSIVHCYSGNGFNATANRDYIVKAVNNHERLLEALKLATDALQFCIDDDAPSQFTVEALDAASKAIQAAEES